MQKGVLVILSGFSGAGKGTVIQELLKKDNYSLSISATTRKPRDGETNGKEYFFKSKEEFEKMIEEDRLIEHARYVDNYYGTPKDYVYEQLEAGKDVILEIEMQGALEVKKKMPEVTTIFLTPPSFEVLRHRLTKRGTETQEQISKRLMRAKEECSYMKEYDYVVTNAELDECVNTIHSLITSLHLKTQNRMAFIEEITKDFEHTV